MSNKSLVAVIKANQLEARFAKKANLATFLTTLFSEIVNVGLNDGKRETTDIEAVAVIRKFIKNAEETFKHSKDPEVQNTATWEIHVLNAYLPQQMTEIQLTNIVKSLLDISDDYNMGTLMAHFKKGFPGEYDGKILSNVIKAQLEAKIKASTEAAIS